MMMMKTQPSVQRVQNHANVALVYGKAAAAVSAAPAPLRKITGGLNAVPRQLPKTQDSAL